MQSAFYYLKLGRHPQGVRPSLLASLSGGLKQAVQSLPHFALIISFLSCTSEADIKFEQYKIAGRALYLTHCANCHGPNAQGLKGLYPSLIASPYLDNTHDLYCIISNGKSRPGFQAMPANKKLYDLDKAQLITYLQSEFTKSTGIVEVVEINKIKCQN